MGEKMANYQKGKRKAAEEAKQKADQKQKEQKTE